MIAIALCVVFSLMPLAAAAETPDSGDNSLDQNMVSDNATTDQDLKIGMTGEKVSELQQWLKEGHFYIGEIDGNYSNYTEEAVKLFQKAADIKEDGWVGNQTMEAIEKWDQGLIPATTSTSSTTVSTAKSESVSTKASTTSTSKHVGTKRSVESGSLNQILASGARYGYSGSVSTAAEMIRVGSGDCWAMSEYLYGRLQAAGIESRIVQYSTSYSSHHRSVQLYQNGAWVDVPYSSYGYSKLFKATSSKPGLKVIAS